MAYYTTHHFSPHWANPHPSQDGGTQHQHPAPITTTITAPFVGPAGSAAANTSTSPSHRHLSLETLAHLLHDFHLQQSNAHGGDPVTHHNIARPHFDLLEDKTTYSIFGELAGLGRKDVNVDVNDRLFAITISGQLKRLAPPALPEPSSAPRDVGVLHRDGAENTDRDGSIDPAAATDAVDGGADNDLHQDVHWHVTERSVGGFRRTFQFPVGTVDLNGVSASMSNGLLCVIVPKKIAETKATEVRRVEVA